MSGGNRDRLIAALHAHLEGDALSLTDAEDIIGELEQDAATTAEIDSPYRWQVRELKRDLGVRQRRIAELEAVVERLAASDPTITTRIGGASIECRFCEGPGHWRGFETEEGVFIGHALDCLHLAARRLMGASK